MSKKMDQLQERLDTGRLSGEDGVVGTRLHVGLFLIPATVTIDGNSLRYEGIEYGFKEGLESRDLHSHKILDEFIRLGNKREKILQFAKKWGILGLCPEHDLPARHDIVAARGFLDESTEVCPSFFRWEHYHGHWPSEGSESLDTWAAFTDQASNLLQMVAYLRKNKRVEKEESDKWNAYWGDRLNRYWGVPINSLDLSLLSQFRSLIQYVIDMWLTAGNVRPSCQTQDDSFYFRLHSDNLFGIIGLQLLNAVSDRNSALCVSCKGLYTPNRRPAQGRRNYCQVCRDEGAHLRDAQQACRDRKKERKLEGK